jgi:succinate dehydrogenase/fumarate reductase flavoprotein subunit
MTLDQLGHVLETDVLILGGGFAGMWAALKARQYAKNVLIVDKGPLNWGGQGSMCGGDMVVWDPEVDIQKWVDDLVYYFDGLIEQDVVEGLMKRSWECFNEYEKMGHSFARDEQGRLRRVKQRALENVGSVLSRPFGAGGKNLVACLVNEMRKLEVPFLSRVQITDILKENGRFAGVVGFHTRSAEFYTIKAKALIIATGNAGWKPSYGGNTCAGETFGMALRAGVKLRNFEYLKVWNVPRDFGWEGQTMLLPLGARFVNAIGEDFMKRYSPSMGAKMDPHYNTRAMVEEYLAGRAPIYFDASQMSPENVSLLTPTTGWIGLNYTRLKDMGMDFFKDKLEWMPQVNYAVGGIDTDLKGMTSIPGIYAAGRARNLESGVYLGGWAVSGTATTGSIAGESAGQYVMSLDFQLEPNPQQVAEIKTRVLEPLGRQGAPYKEVLNEVRKAIVPYDVTIIKTGAGLERALKRLKTISQEMLPRIGAETPHHLMKRNEVQGMVEVAELYLNASLLRKESRGSHHREEYPHRDDRSLGWYIASWENGKLVWDFRPVPLERYPIKPYRYYMDNYIPLADQHGR